MAAEGFHPRVPLCSDKSGFNYTHSLSLLYQNLTSSYQTFSSPTGFYDGFLSPLMLSLIERVCVGCDTYVGQQ